MGEEHGVHIGRAWGRVLDGLGYVCMYELVGVGVGVGVGMGV